MINYKKILLKENISDNDICRDYIEAVVLFLATDHDEKLKTFLHNNYSFIKNRIQAPIKKQYGNRVLCYRGFNVVEEKFTDDDLDAGQIMIRNIWRNNEINSMIDIKAGIDKRFSHWAPDINTARDFSSYSENKSLYENGFILKANILVEQIIFMFDILDSIDAENFPQWAAIEREILVEGNVRNTIMIEKFEE